MMLMELKGINIAATKGDKCPVIAKESPVMLYNNESPKLTFTIPMESFEKSKRDLKFLSSLLSKMASQAGAKELVLSERAIPK